jgi:selenide,water dikinase
VALGLVHPSRVKRNAAAQAGDVLVLGKPLGVGVLSAALKQGLLDAEGYAEMLGHTTRLNRVGSALGAMPGVHALTDVTGFGLLGHLLEICRGSGLNAEVAWPQLPLIGSAVRHAQAGLATGASRRNWASYGAEVELPPGLEPWQQVLLTDPQTSGGLLAACAPDSVDAVLASFHAAGFADAAVVGQMLAASLPVGTAGPAPRVALRLTSLARHHAQPA